MEATFKARFLVLVATFWAVNVAAQSASEDPGAIVVTGKRAEQADVAANQAKEITPRPAGDAPLARRYAPVCVKLFGIDPNYGAVIAERIYANLATLKLPRGKPDCQPNVWIGFIKNSEAEVKALRKREPAMFAAMKQFEIDRIFAGSGAVQVWHATEIRSSDGRPIPIVQLNLGGDGKFRPIETGYNAQYQAGRLTSPIRNDINGTIVLFDRDRANGKTVQQLADYANFRILAPVQDYAAPPERAMPTILTLFTPGAEAPDGLTEFDWAFLSAFYKLDRGARAANVHDSVKQAVLDGKGQTLKERSEAPVP